MVAPIKSLLFATNLSEECRPALENAVATATFHQANLVLLHVIVSDSPEYINQELKDLLGKEKWEELRKEYRENVEKSLIGKMSYSGIGQKVLQQYCKDAGIDANSCNINWRHIVSADKDLPGEIIRQATENGCDFIILGATRGFLGGNSLGTTIKGVLRQSKIPVMVVPSTFGA